jgi:hypothetical protein
MINNEGEIGGAYSTYKGGDREMRAGFWWGKPEGKRLNGTLRHRRSGFGGLVVSMLASGTRVRGFKPGRSLIMPSFGREVKPFAPCRRFAAC